MRQSRESDNAISNFKLFKNVYIRASVATNVISGFTKCEIEPYNLDVFGEAYFAPSEVTNNSITAVANYMEYEFVSAQTSSTSCIDLCDG